MLVLNLNRPSGLKTVVNVIGQIISGIGDLMIASKLRGFILTLIQALVFRYF